MKTLTCYSEGQIYTNEGRMQPLKKKKGEKSYLFGTNSMFGALLAKVSCLVQWPLKVIFLVKSSFINGESVLHQTNNEKNENTFSHPFGKMETTPRCMDFYGSSEAMVR